MDAESLKRDADEYLRNSVFAGHIPRDEPTYEYILLAMTAFAAGIVARELRDVIGA